MGHGTEHHLEHAEHAQHHAADPFASRVAMTMAILAAILAGVTLASHRGHTETLHLATQATTKFTEAADKWNEYQAQNIRAHEYRAYLSLEYLLAKDGIKEDDKAKAFRAYWMGQLDKYEGQGAWKKFEESRLSGKKSEAPPEKNKDKPDPKVFGQLATLRWEAEQLEKVDAAGLNVQSHKLHGLVTWIDMGHLGLEIALVFCAVAVLTKSRKFLLAGIGTGLVGALVAGYGIVMWSFFFDVGGGHH